jgi:hypothetical protein
MQSNDVIDYWNAIRNKWGNPLPEFQDLHPMHQMQIVQSINLLIMVINQNSGQQ